MLLVPDSYLFKFNEVEINGQSADDDNQDSDYTAPDPVNAAGADNNSPADNPPADDNSPEGDPADQDTDYTQDADEGDNPTPDDDGEDTDYTADGDMGDPDAEGGDPSPEDGGGDGGAPAGGGEQVTADDARGMEQELFKDLTPDQIDMKHQELKSNFTKLYDSTNSIIERINDIPSNENYLASITFVSEKLSELRTMVADYMNNVYSTKSYMENAINYNRFLSVLKSINDILDEISREVSSEEPK